MSLRLRPPPRRLALASVCAATLLAGLAALGACVGAPEAVSAQASPYGYHCSAGFYRCRLAAQYPLGSQCTCPGIGAPSYGVVSN